jgi:hypothetical protein
VVKSSPWSADSGGVPDAIVIVPPGTPAAADVELEDELDELPHAASATALPIATTAIKAARRCLLIDPSS